MDLAGFETYPFEWNDLHSANVFNNLNMKKVMVFWKKWLEQIQSDRLQTKSLQFDCTFYPSGESVFGFANNARIIDNRENNSHQLQH